MSIFDDFDIIWDHSHYWNWSPDWLVVKEVYEKVPNSYSVLMPFAYSYFEEMIRTTTSEYGLPLFDRHGKPVKFKVGMALIKMAIEENQANPDYVALLEKAKNILPTQRYQMMRTVETELCMDMFILVFGVKKILKV